MSKVEIRKTRLDDKDWITRRMIEEWGSARVVIHGDIYHPAECRGLTAVENGKIVGLITYHIKKKECEIITLNAWVEGRGIGKALVDAVQSTAIHEGCSKLLVTTTNDNTLALRFYQRIGFSLAALYPGIVHQSRKIKPEIPHYGLDGIPIQDEIRLELILQENG